MPAKVFRSQFGARMVSFTADDRHGKLQHAIRTGFTARNSRLAWLLESHRHELAGTMEQTFVVASQADKKKGERLVVPHKLADEKLQSCLEKLAQSDLPNLGK